MDGAGVYFVTVTVGKIVAVGFLQSSQVDLEMSCVGIKRNIMKQFFHLLSRLVITLLR